jgi:hypothetical protein
MLGGLWPLPAPYLRVVGRLIKEIQDLACLNFTSFQISVVCRSCNRTAHVLAALGCECREDDNPVVDPLRSSLYSDDCDYRYCGV